MTDDTIPDRLEPMAILNIGYMDQVVLPVDAALAVVRGLKMGCTAQTRYRGGENRRYIDLHNVPRVEVELLSGRDYAAGILNGGDPDVDNDK